MAWDEDVLARFDAYHWHTQRVADGNDLEAIDGGPRRGARRSAAQPHRRAHPHRLRLAAQAGQPEGPRLAARRGRGAPDQGGLRLGSGPPLLRARPRPWATSARRSRRASGWSRAGTARFEAYAAAYPAEAAEFRRRLAAELPAGWDGDLPTYGPGDDRATRQASQEAIQALAPRLPELFGGAADLSESNLTDVKGAADFEAGQPGRNLRFGVREHAMGGAANGLALHGGFLPYAGTFLNFSDYMRGSVRLAALSALHVVYVWTHDSVGLGEDGPTHQPVEHYAALRAMPRLLFVRPGDPNEAIAAWRLAVGHADGPVAPVADPPEAARPGRHGRPRGRGRGPWRLRPGRGRRRERRGRAAGRHPAGHRFRAPAGRGRPRRACSPRASPPVSSPCPAGSASPSSRPRTARRCCRRRCGRA